MNYKNVLPIALSLLGISGVIATAVFVAKETPKFNQDLEKLKENENAKKTDVIKLAMKDYAPALVIGGATIASVASSTILSKKNEMTLSGVALLADSGWRKYKDKVKQILGIETHKDILNKISLDDFNKLNKKDDEHLYWEEHIGFFKANPEKLAYAYSDINRGLHDDEYTVGSYKGVSSLKTFLKNAEAKMLDDDIDSNTNLYFGWDIDYLYDKYGYIWVNMNLEEVKDDDGNSYTKILFLEDPIYLEEFESYYKGE